MKKTLFSLILISNLAYAADFTVDFNPSANSVDDSKVSSISSSKISDFATAVLSAVSSTLSNFLQKNDIKAPTVFKYTSGSGTHNVSAGVKWLRVKLVGGGGGGQGGNNSGWGTSGLIGTHSRFDNTLLVANPGSGGYVNGGLGGSYSVAADPSISYSFGVVGGMGGAGQSKAANADFASGAGGNSFFGGAGGGAVGASNGMSASANSGAGASGGALTIGASGIVGAGGGAGGYVEAVIINPKTSYSYTVGVGGGGGSNTTDGGTGGSGVVIVEEHYQ